MSLLRNIGIGRTKLIRDWMDQNILPFRSPSYFHLISLRGCPEGVVGDFECIGCTCLKNLIGSPRVVYGTLNPSYSYNLESIKGAPEYVEKLNTLGISSEIQDKLWEKYQSQQVF